MSARSWDIDGLKAVCFSEKATSDIPEWAIRKHNSGEEVHFTRPLWIDGEIKLGLKLEMKGQKLVRVDRPFLGLTALMFASVGGQTLHLSRLEFDPESVLKPHFNRPNKVEAPAVIHGPHFHPFAENCALGIDALGLKDDLPIAFPFDKQFETFNDVMDTVRTAFVIPGLWMEEPPCSTTIV